MKRICNNCKFEKELEQFVKGANGLHRYKCKDCKNVARRTGRSNTGRFKTGQKSIGVTFQKGHIPWYKKRGLEHPSKGKVNENNENRATSFKYKEWRRQVLERDSNRCTKCGADENVHAHHVKPWRDYPELRFDVGNGLALCNCCHGKEEGFQKGHKVVLSAESLAKIRAANRGRKFSEETKAKMRAAKVGKSPPNKGKSPSEESRRKMSEAKKGKSCKNGFKKQHVPWNKGINSNTVDNIQETVL